MLASLSLLFTFSCFTIEVTEWSANSKAWINAEVAGIGEALSLMITCFFCGNWQETDERNCD